MRTKKMMAMLTALTFMAITATAQATVYQAEDCVVSKTHSGGVRVDDGKFGLYKYPDKLCHGKTFLLHQKEPAVTEANVLHLRLTGLKPSTECSFVLALSLNPETRDSGLTLDYSYVSAADAVSENALTITDNDYLSVDQQMLDYKMANVTSSAAGVVDIYFGKQSGRVGAWRGIDQLTLAPPTKPVRCNVTSLEDFNLKAGGWNITGKWQDNKPVLNIDCRNSGNSDAVLSLTFPAMGRDQVKRFTLSGTKTEHQFTYSPPWTGKGNPYNRYILKATLTTDSDELTRNVVLAGRESDAARLGAPLNTQDIEKSIVGSNEHINFTHGRVDHPMWAGWADYKTLIDLMADAGIKWIRGAVGVLKDEQGNYIGAEPWTLEWMGYAKKKNINLIGGFNLAPWHEPEVVRQRCRVIADGYKGLIDVFEIGNEPENFTGWRKEKKYIGKPGKYDGSWNGLAKDGSTAEWVKEYVKMTNIAAEEIRKARPEVTILGLGSSPPANHRMLELGISKAVDGIAEHPYSYSMPPERLAYGLPFAQRDGVRVGDEDCSFLGVMNSMLAYSKKTGKERSLWITEFGPTSFWHGEKVETNTLYSGFTEKAQAVYTVRRFIQCLTVPEIKVACQYAFLDDHGSDPWDNGANFGLLRADYSPKPSYYAVQRFTSLFNDCEPDNSATITVEKAPLHRSMKRRVLVDDWDKVVIKADNSVYAYGFKNPEVPHERQLAVWSGLPVSGEFNSRFASIRIKGWKGFGNLVAIDMITGNSFDVPVKADGDDLIIDLILTDNPLVIKMFKE